MNTSGSNSQLKQVLAFLGIFIWMVLIFLVVKYSNDLPGIDRVAYIGLLFPMEDDGDE